MVAELSATFDTKGWEAALKRAPKEIGKELHKSFNLIGQAFTAKMTKERLRGRPGLKRGTGGLLRSQQHVTRGETIGNVKLLYSIGGNRAPYAFIHEYGGDIVPVNKQWLTVPLDAALTAAGVLRMPAPDFPDTFIQRVDGGSPIIFQKVEGGDPIPLFVLRKKVTIPARLGMRKAWKDSAELRRKLLKRGLERALRNSTTKGKSI